MPIPAAETHAGASRATIPDRITDGVRHAAHFAHQVRLMKSIARDAGEEGVHAAKRLMRRVNREIERLDDLKHEAAYRIRHEPLKAVGIAAGAGALIGIAIGCIGVALGRKAACRR